jgi:hypothetical protein
MVMRRLQAVKDDSEHEATAFLGPLFDLEMEREGTGVTSKIVLKALALLFDFGVQRTRLTWRNSERLNPTRAVAKVRERYRLTSVMPLPHGPLPIGADGSPSAFCSVDLSGSEEFTDIGRIFSRFPERMPAWSLADEFREPRFVLDLLMQDGER